MPHGGLRPNAGRPPTRKSRVVAALIHLQRADGTISADPKLVSQLTRIQPNHCAGEIRKLPLVTLGGHLRAWDELEFGRKACRSIYSSLAGVAHTAQSDSNDSTDSKTGQVGFPPEFKFWRPRKDLWVASRRGLRPSGPELPRADRLRLCWELEAQELAARVAKRLGCDMTWDPAAVRALAARLSEGVPLRELLDRAAHCVRGLECHGKLRSAWGRDHGLPDFGWDGSERGAWWEMTRDARALERLEEQDRVGQEVPTHGRA